MKDGNMGRLLLTLQLILLYQIIWHLKVCHAESLRVADLARGTSKNRLSLCDHPFHAWMCSSSSRGKSLSEGPSLKSVRNNQHQVSFSTPKSITPSTLVVTLPAENLSSTEDYRKQSLPPELQQILFLPSQVVPPSYAYEANSNYDMCSHPFHAWLCGKPKDIDRENLPIRSNIKTMLLTTALPRNTVPDGVLSNSGPFIDKSSKELTHKNIQHSNQLIHSEPQFKESAVSENHDRCSHPFQSFLCPKLPPTEPPKNQITTSIPKLSKTLLLKSSNMISETVTQFPNQTTKLHYTAASDSDPCNHAFHSWMCAKSIKRTSAKPTITTQTPKLSKSLHTKSSNVIFVPVTETPKQTTKAHYAAAHDSDPCNHAFHSWMCTKAIKRTSAKPTSTTQTPKLSKSLLTKSSNVVVVPVTESPKPTTKAHYVAAPDSDPCNHAFHSWMCAKTIKRTSAKPTSTTPAPKLSKSLLTKSSNVVVVPVTESPKSTTKAHYVAAPDSDPCNHAFHSWMCAKPIKRTSAKPTSTTPTPKLSKSLLTKSSNVNVVPVTETPKPTTKAHYVAAPDSDPCNHAFHSWMCAKPIKRTSIKPTSTTSTPKLSKSLLTKSSNVVVVPVTESPKPTTKAHYVAAPDSDPCNHAFHSWMCAKTIKRTSAKPTSTTPAPKLSKSLLTKSSNVVVPVTETPKPTTKAHYVAAPDSDPCNHAFHSWMCAKSIKRTSAKPTSTTPAPKLSKNLLPKSSNVVSAATESPKPTTKAHYSAASDGDPCNHAFHSWLCGKAPKRTSAKPTSTTPSPKLSKSLLTKSSIVNVVPVTETPKLTTKAHYVAAPDSDPCNHAFHSWMCAKPIKRISAKPTSTTPTPKLSKSLLTKSSNVVVVPVTESPKPTTKAHYVAAPDSNPCNHAFHSWMCSKTIKRTSAKPTSTTPAPKLSKSLLTKSSNVVVVPVTKTPKPTTKAHYVAAPDNDPCNHAFHSWMCSKTIKRTSVKPISTTPAPKLGKTLIPKSSKVVVPVTETPKPPTKVHYTDSDPCNHAFHSYLCTKPSNQLSTKRPITSTFIPNLKKSLLPVYTEFNCDDWNSFSHPLYFVKCPVKQTTSTAKSLTSTTRFTTSTARPITSTVKPKTSTARTTTSTIATTTPTVMPATFIVEPNAANSGKSLGIPIRAPTKAPNLWEGSDPCTHAFHAWLCQPLRPKLSQPPFSPPRHPHNFIFHSAEKSSKSLVPPRVPTTFALPSSKVPVTVTNIKQERHILEGFHSNVDNNEKKNISDMCSHAFHSFLCNKTSRKPANVDISPQSNFFGKSLSVSQNPIINSQPKTGDRCSQPFNSWRCLTFENRKYNLALDQIPNIMSLPLEDEKPSEEEEKPQETRNPRRVNISDRNLKTNSLPLNAGLEDKLSAEKSINGSDLSTMDYFLDDEVENVAPHIPSGIFSNDKKIELSDVHLDDNIYHFQVDKEAENLPPLKNLYIIVKNNYAAASRTNHQVTARSPTISTTDSTINVINSDKSKSYEINIERKASNGNLKTSPNLPDLLGSRSSTLISKTFPKLPELLGSRSSTLDSLASPKVPEILGSRISTLNSQTSPKLPELLGSSSSTLNSQVINYHDYDMSVPLSFESRRTIPRKINI